MNSNEHPAFVNPDEGIDFDSPVENGEISLYELTSEMDRPTLSRWAAAILPGSDIVALHQRVRVGDLILNRPGSPSFEVYSRSDYASIERVQARIAILQKVSSLEAAKQWDAWVHGDDVLR